MSNIPDYGTGFPGRQQAPPPAYNHETQTYPKPQNSAPYESHGNRIPAPGYQYIHNSELAEDDFQYGPSLSQSSVEIRKAFVAKVYSILTAQIFGTFIFSLLFTQVASIQLFLFRHIWVVYLSMFLAIGNLFLLFWKRHSYPTNFILLASFTFIESISIGTVVSFYSSRVVLQALILTLGIFLALTLFAFQTKYDFSAWQPYLYGFLWVLILVPLVQIFIPFSTGFELLLAVGSALLFSVYILVDTQNIMYRLSPDEYIVASVELYLDVINLFLALLRILASRDD